MTTYLITEAQRQTLLDTYRYDGVNKWEGNIDMLQSLPTVDSEPVAWCTQSGSLVNAALNLKTDALTYGWQSLYTSPQALTPITADDVSDKTVIDLWRIGVLTSTGTQGKEIAAKVYNAVIKHKAKS